VEAKAFELFKANSLAFQDEYKEIVYARNPAKFQDVDAGNLTRCKAIRSGMHCKPFRYFIEYVAPDMLERYPIEDPGHFAKGTIQSRAALTLCIEASHQRKLTLNTCESNHAEPSVKQSFTLTWHRSIQHHRYDICLQSSLTLNECHFRGGNQLWKFDLTTKQIINPLAGNERCLSLDVDTKTLSLEVCNADDLNQKWNWGEKNISALMSWATFGVSLDKLTTT